MGISKQTFQGLFGKDEVNVKDYDLTAFVEFLP